MPVSPSWIRRQEDKGNLMLPRSTTNFKMAQGARRLGAVRYMTKEQITGVLMAFLPEGTRLPTGEIAHGKGYYNYKLEE
jgi:1-acyl-sn-glycerol-3-phosphate acyltransferase